MRYGKKFGNHTGKRTKNKSIDPTKERIANTDVSSGETRLPRKGRQSKH